MKTWGKILKALCEEAQKEGKDIYILEGDSSLNWFGVPLKNFCRDENYEKEDSKLFKEIKKEINTQLSNGGYLILISPMNMWADVYESKSQKFKNPANLERPFDVSFDRFRVGFFKDKEEAVDFILKVSKRLNEEFNLHLHVFYTS